MFHCTQFPDRLKEGRNVLRHVLETRTKANEHLEYMVYASNKEAASRTETHSNVTYRLRSYVLILWRIVCCLPIYWIELAVLAQERRQTQRLFLIRCRLVRFRQALQSSAGNG